MVRRVGVLLLLVLLVGALPALAGPEKSASANHQLLKYVTTPDPAYGWVEGPTQTTAYGTINYLILTTQQWRGITWRHLVRIYTPNTIVYPEWMTMLINGGSGQPNPGPRGDDALALTIANTIGYRVAFLDTVPNQPLFDGLKEDQIISYTFQEFLKDGDWTWPLLFPMTKSAVRAMDALQEYARQKWSQEITSFTVTGASKRGWTTWLTGAVDGGERVKAIAPMVIDTLNFRDQFPRELELWGHYSEEITDYTEKGLTEIFNLPLGRELWRAVDPYTYRMNLRMPKLLLLGTNDPYWPTDALNLYWQGLQGPKYVLYDPNSGHDLDDTARALAALTAFCRTVAAGHEMPGISWQRQVEGDQLTLTITAPGATAARLWSTTADDLDFRPCPWSSQPITGSGGVFTIAVQRPADKNMVAFGEVDLVSEGLPFTLSTQNTILAK